MARFARVLIEEEVYLGATSVVIATALITEYFHTLSVTPSQLLTGLTSKLRTCPGVSAQWFDVVYSLISITIAIVQEPCILAMIRISAYCDEIPSDIRDVIDDISKTASAVVRTVRPITAELTRGWRFSQRCAQFIKYSEKKEELSQIIQQASSPSVSNLQLHLISADFVPLVARLPPILIRVSSIYVESNPYFFSISWETANKWIAIFRVSSTSSWSPINTSIVEFATQSVFVVTSGISFDDCRSTGFDVWVRYRCQPQSSSRSSHSHWFTGNCFSVSEACHC